MFIAAAIIFGIYFGFMFGISLLSPWLGIDLGPGYENAEVHYFHSVQWGVYWGILICGSLLCLAWKPLKKPIVMEFIIIVSVIYIVAALSFGHGILPVLMAVPIVIVIACYPGLGSLFSLKANYSKPLLVVTVIAGIAMFSGVWDSFYLEVTQHDEHHKFQHWLVSALLPIFLFIGGILTATQRMGWITLSILLGISYVYLGVSSLLLPDYPSSWNGTVAILTIIIGMTYFILNWFDKTINKNLTVNKATSL